MTWSLSSSNSRKSCPFFLLLLKETFHVSNRWLHSFFLLNRNKFLLGRVGGVWDALTSLSTKACLGHFSLLGQYQNYIVLWLSFSRNDLIFMAIGIINFWKDWLPEFMIFCSATKESMTTMMCWRSLLSSTDVRPMYSHEFCFHRSDVGGMSFEVINDCVVFPNISGCCC